MAIINERGGDYTDAKKEQLDKEASVKISKTLVQQIQDAILPFVKSCEEYEPDEKLKLSGAPAVLINNKLVIAPDLKCETKKGNTFWIEVKDKCQRFFMPDTGADIHQVLGWYDIDKNKLEPVLVIFRDPPLDKCLVKNKDSARYTERWNRFAGQPYGNWLSALLDLDSKTQYPKLYPEHSRQGAMNICYFHVNKMLLVSDSILQQFVSVVDANAVPRVPANLQVYLKEDPGFKLINETTTRSLSIGG